MIAFFKNHMLRPAQFCSAWMGGKHHRYAWCLKAPLLWTTIWWRQWERKRYSCPVERGVSEEVKGVRKRLMWVVFATTQVYRYVWAWAAAYGHVWIPGPVGAKVYVDVCNSCYHRRPWGCHTLGCHLGWSFLSIPLLPVRILEQTEAWQNYTE